MEPTTVPLTFPYYRQVEKASPVPARRLVRSGVKVLLAVLLPALAHAEGSVVPEAPAREVAPPPPLSLPPDPSAAETTPSEPPPPPPPAPHEAAKPTVVARSAAPAPAPRDEPTPGSAFVHDGFYLRLAFGGAYGKTSVKTDRVSQPDVTLSGFGGAFDAWCGWSLGRGVTLGPALSLSSQRTSKSRVEGRETVAGSALSGLLGAFIDAYPNPQRGEHFGGLLGLASLKQTTADQRELSDFTAGGVAVAVFAGYDAWIAREWSLGALLRLGGALVGGSQTAEGQTLQKRATSYEAALLVSLLYH